MSQDQTLTLVTQLRASFLEQLRRAIGSELPEDADEAMLAYVDHYLSMLREEQREPIISLVAAGAGAWFGEFVRAIVGGQWIGDGKDPRRLRLLLEIQFVHFSPVDMAYEAIFIGSPDPGDLRLPAATELDGAYHLRKTKDEGAGEDEPSEHDWVSEQLARTAPVPEDQYYSLTGRYETLTLILELLATHAVSHGREPTRYHLNDYVAALAP